MIKSNISKYTIKLCLPGDSDGNRSYKTVTLWHGNTLRECRSKWRKAISRHYVSQLSVVDAEWKDITAKMWK